MDKPVRTVAVIICATSTLLKHTFMFCFCLYVLAKKPMDSLRKSLRTLWVVATATTAAFQLQTRPPRKGWTNIYPSLLVPHTILYEMDSEVKGSVPFIQSTQTLANPDLLAGDSNRSFFIYSLSSVTSSEVHYVFVLFCFLSGCTDWYTLTTALPAHEINSWAEKCGRLQKKEAC